MKLIHVVVLSLVMMAGSVVWAGPVDINTADVATLSASLQGVGEKRAQAIVEYRNANGPFKTVDELRQVKGIGAVTVEKNRDNLTVGPAK